MKRILFFIITLIAINQAHAQMASSRLLNIEPSSKRITLPGNLTLNYYEKGSKLGVPVILLHGYTDSYHTYDSLLPFLNDKGHFYAVTLRGFGDSDKPEGVYSPTILASDINNFMQKLNIESAILIGHSMGAAVAQRFALDYPGKTKALVLISTISDFRTNPLVQELSESINAMKATDYEFARAFQRSSIEKMIDSSYFNLLVGESMKVPLHVWKSTITALKNIDYSNELGAIKAPVLILYGEKDPLCPRNGQIAMQKKLKQSRLIGYRDIGHTPHWEIPEKTATDINFFLENLVR